MSPVDFMVLYNFVKISKISLNNLPSYARRQYGFIVKKNTPAGWQRSAGLVLITPNLMTFPNLKASPDHY
jgi:hypothetical protein